MKRQVIGLVQERRNSTANAMELHLSCTNPSEYKISVNSLRPSDTILAT